MKKIGIFGGTFNPIHNGHIHAMKTVMDYLKLDKVIVMPAKIPPHKQGAKMASEFDRFTMCKLATAHFKNVEVSDFEIKNEGKSYSIITLSHLKKIYPDDKIYFIMGSDMLLYFKNWYKYDEILKLTSLACVSRDDEDNEAMRKAREELVSEGGEVEIIPTEPYEISSTEIREKLKNGEDCSCYLDELVVKYLNDNQIYA